MPDVLSPTQREALSRVIAVAVAKGGVGKTSLVATLAGLLAFFRYRVLVIDLDPQASELAGGNLGDDLGYAGVKGIDDVGADLRDALLEQRPLRPVKDIRPGLDVVPGGECLLKVVRQLYIDDDDRVTATALANVIAPIAHLYDVILLDCGGDEPLQNAALGAAKYLVVPFRSDKASRKGVYRVGQRFQRMKEHNPSLTLLGVVLFAISSRAPKIRELAEKEIHDAFGGAAPFLGKGIRSAEAVATQARERGLLVHEMTSDGKSMRDHVVASRTEQKAGSSALKSASPVAKDHLDVMHALMANIKQHEGEARQQNGVSA